MMRRRSAPRTRLLAGILGTAAVSAGVLACPAAGATLVSDNWSGYVARTSATVRSFRSVSGSWTQPSATCTAGREAFSAVWVGLGGYRSGAKGLEQIGTEADCTRAGTARYSAWLELLPAASTPVHMQVHPGDQMKASVTVIGHDATLRINDVTTGAALSRTVRLKVKDVSSAEWIVEAPSVCSAEGACHTLALADFGTASFTSATATTGGHTEPVQGGLWPTTELLLQQPGAVTAAGRHGPLERALVSATPSQTFNELGGFTVAWSEQTTQSEAPSGPTLPGFGEGPS